MIADKLQGMRGATLSLAGCALATLSAAACTREPVTESLSPNARPGLTKMLREDLEAVRHPADGAGTAWLEDGPSEVRAGSWNRWLLAFETGPLGIAEGGMIFFQAPPFWGWSTPQTLAPDFEGYTLVSTDAEGVELQSESYGQQLLGVRVTGRALEPEEHVFFDYGAGAAGARADRYAERESRFWFAVDGDGDGIRKLVDDSPAIAVRAGLSARLQVTLPSTLRIGEEGRVTLAVLDAVGNAGAELAEEVRLLVPEGLEAPEEVSLTTNDRGRTTLSVIPRRAGLFRLRAETEGGLAGESNPLRVAAEDDTVLWADLHGHSGLSDGTGTPADYLTYARDVAALDVVALTDHDHWGLRPLSLHPGLWAEIRTEIDRFHQSGRFVTVLGFEWTNWTQGHRHVLSFDGDLDVSSSVDPSFDTPDELWAALRGRPAITLAHHSAGQPVATNWDYVPDPVLEPVTEVVSVHGSSEAADSPRPVAGALPGNFVRDALDRGYRLGLVGSGDSHDGHPGFAHLASPSGGLAALVGGERTRESVLETLRARRVYATNGPRILLAASLDGEPIGASLPARDHADLQLRVAGTAALEAVDIIRSGEIFLTVEPTGRDFEQGFALSDLDAGEYLYVRVVQVDGGAAWSSPFFFD